MFDSISKSPPQHGIFGSNSKYSTPLGSFGSSATSPSLGFQSAVQASSSTRTSIFDKHDDDDKDEDDSENDESEEEEVTFGTGAKPLLQEKEGELLDQVFNILSSGQFIYNFFFI